MTASFETEIPLGQHPASFLSDHAGERTIACNGDIVFVYNTGTLERLLTIPFLGDTVDLVRVNEHHIYIRSQLRGPLTLDSDGGIVADDIAGNNWIYVSGSQNSHGYKKLNAARVNLRVVTDKDSYDDPHTVRFPNDANVWGVVAFDPNIAFFTAGMTIGNERSGIYNAHIDSFHRVAFAVDATGAPPKIFAFQGLFVIHESLRAQVTITRVVNTMTFAYATICDDLLNIQEMFADTVNDTVIFKQENADECRITAVAVSGGEIVWSFVTVKETTIKELGNTVFVCSSPGVVIFRNKFDAIIISAFRSREYISVIGITDTHYTCVNRVEDEDREPETYLTVTPHTIRCVADNHAFQTEQARGALRAFFYVCVALPVPLDLTYVANAFRGMI